MISTAYPKTLEALGQVPFDSIFGEPLAPCSCLEATAAAARTRLITHNAVYLRDFHPDAEEYIDFLRLFGAPLPNYSAGEDLPAYSLHPCINRVRCEAREGPNLRFHEQGGELIPHSARSWSLLRPRYFSMRMVDPGWIDCASGLNGESLLVRWSDVLAWLAREQPSTFASDYSLLSGVPLHFQANNVVEETSALPLIYPLQGSVHPLDMGVRMKVDIAAKLAQKPEQLPSDYLPALARFREAADLPINRCCYQMTPGDMVIIDNNRFGHGRHAVIHSRAAEPDGARILNPRELWSVALI